MPNTFAIPKIPAQGIYSYRGRTGDWAFPLKDRQFLPEHLPRFNHIGHLIAPLIVKPDTELYRTRKEKLVPLSRQEQIFADIELYDRIDKLYKKLGRTAAALQHRPERVYETLVKAKGCYDHSQELLSPLLNYYNELGLRRPLDDVQQDSRAVDSISEVLLAEQAQAFKWPKETQDEREERKAEASQAITGSEPDTFRQMADRVVITLGNRSLFWMDELGTVVMHPALRELDQALAADLDNGGQVIE